MTKTANYNNDSELVTAVKAGDESAFRFLVEKFRKKVISTSMGFLHSEADADDVAQEVFIEVFRSVEKFRSDSSLSTWIYRITVNKALNYLRQTNRKKLISLFDYENTETANTKMEPVSDRESCPDDGLRKSEQAAAISQAMNNLSSNQRTAFILSKYDDLSYREVAEIMNTSVPSVESLIFRAKQNLQKSLYRYYKKNIE